MSEEFFWKLHSLPEDRWTRHSTVLFDEELQYEGEIYVKHCEEFNVSIQKTVALLKD